MKACDIPFNNNFTGYATVYKNTPNFLPLPGDLAIFHSGYGGGYGHVSIVLSATLNSFVSLDQNWFGGGANKTEVAQRITHNYDNPMYFIRPHYSNEKPTTKNEVKKPIGDTMKTNVSLAVGKVPPMSLANSSKAYFRAKTDQFGAAICKFNNGGYYVTNETYAAGYDQFYIYEIVNGWARVYSSTNNGWVWYERLRIVETYKQAKSTAIAKNLSVGAIPPTNLKLSQNAYCEAVADQFGVTITDRNGNLKNEQYNPGQVFYVFECVNGYCRVYSPTNNGYVWHERLIITKVY